MLNLQIALLSCNIIAGEYVFLLREQENMFITEGGIYE